MSVLKGKFVIIFPQDKHRIKEQATMELYKMQNSSMLAAPARTECKLKCKSVCAGCMEIKLDGLWENPV